MRTKNHNWVNVKTKETLFGIKVSIDGKKWKNVSSCGQPYFADSEEQREKDRAVLRKSKL